MTPHLLPARHRLHGLVVAVALVFVSLAAAIPARAQPAYEQSDAISDLADCAARTGKLSVVFLVDESASLQRTDPDNRRVDAIQTALYGLADVADRTSGTEQPISVDVAMLGFGVSTTTVVDWAPLDGNRLGDFLATSRQFADRNQDIDTDYAAAVLGARDALAPRVTPDAAPTCTAVLWFTDGEYDIEARATGESKSYAPDIQLTGPEAAVELENAGKSLLCQDGGVIDGLRANGTEVFAIALSADISPENQDFLRAVAEGSAGNSRCGWVRPPGSSPVGTFLSTDDVGQLIARFFDLVNRLAGGTPLPTQDELVVCSLDPCDSGSQRFAVDPGITSFNVLALTSASGIDVELQSAEPGSAPLSMSADTQSGDQPLGSATVHWTWVSADGLLVDVDLPSDSGPWNGDWTATFIDRTGDAPNAVANARIFVFGDIEPFIEADTFRAGEAQEFRVGVKHREGTPVNEDVFQSVDIDAVVVDPSTGNRERIPLSEPDENGLRTGVWTAPSPNFPSFVNLSATARIITESGQSLTPVTRTVPVNVLPPSSYPTVEPSELRFGTITGTDPKVLELRVRGGDESGGCVWVDNAEVGQSPDDAKTVNVEFDPAAASADSCLHVAAGQAATLAVKVAPTSPANGVTAGDLSITLVSDNNPDVLRTSVAWSAQLEKPLDAAKAAWVTAVLLLVGFLLPLLLMWLLNWVTARFDPPGELRMARIPVLVTSSGNVSRRDSPSPGVAVQVADFVGIDGSSKTRSFSVRGLDFRSRVPKWPVSAPYGEVQSEGCAVGSLPPPAVGRQEDTAPVPFGLAGTAIVLIPDKVLDDAVGSSREVAAAGSTRLGIAADGGAKGGTGTRADLAIDLVLFARATNLAGYAKHFDGHRTEIAAVVDALYERHEANTPEAGPVVSPNDEPPRTGRDIPPPPGRSATSSSPPSRSSGPSPTGRSGAASQSSNGLPPVPPPRKPDGGGDVPPSSNAGDPGPPPGRH